MAIKESEWEASHQLEFSALTSCLTVTLVMKTGYLVGAHFVADQKDQIDRILQGMKGAITLFPDITSVYFVGVTGFGSEAWDLSEIKMKICRVFGSDAFANVVETSGESEKVQISISGKDKIKISIKYPDSAKGECKNSGAANYDRVAAPTGWLEYI